MSAGLLQVIVGVILEFTVTPTRLLAALVTEFTVCFAVRLCRPRPSVRLLLQLPLPSAVVDPAADRPSNSEIVAPANEVPVTNTVLFVVLEPSAGEVIDGAGGATDPFTVLPAALTMLLTVCFAVRLCVPMASETLTLKFPLPSAVVDPTRVVPSLMDTEAF